ncbi:hypothetical protein EC968_010518 [Mortierella alpina]|nr:hypothetical protein EC968_010518 [Mortierella alpina]
MGGPVIQQVQFCWGLEGTNVTRFAKTEATRLEPSLDHFSDSLDAIITLLLFRSGSRRRMVTSASYRGRIRLFHRMFSAALLARHAWYINKLQPGLYITPALPAIDLADRAFLSPMMVYTEFTRRIPARVAGARL